MPKNSNLLPDPDMDKPQGTTFDNQLIELESVDSTNNYAMARIHAGLASSGEVYFAHQQWAGKGQRGKAWISEPGRNISMSLVLEPPLILSQQFLLGAAVAVGCLESMQKYTAGWKIKWPNDLYWGDRKAAGILIENVIKGNEWLFAVIGVGVNLNQISFPPELTNPISLKQITGENYQPLLLAREIIDQILANVKALQKDPGAVLIAYNQHLYKRGEMVKLKKGRARFETFIDSVNEQGRLVTGEGEFGHGEVSWLIVDGFIS